MGGLTHPDPRLGVDREPVDQDPPSILPPTLGESQRRGFVCDTVRWLQQERKLASQRHEIPQPTVGVCDNVICAVPSLDKHRFGFKQCAHVVVIAVVRKRVVHGSPHMFWGGRDDLPAKFGGWNRDRCWSRRRVTGRGGMVFEWGGGW
ncbi:hypothetical protein H257_05253 [Aphanomyces astaci]|uniref:Uncharacterized protein n=1 Tax=Aphanomyces astaci TaxID=112090 RepID=W4GSL9_APHAT|nr:hypothetical protein H257_05253 [Aphanomyces astaci]ETV82687.1 hypothetical protein H257_05253 [Aphanomyces astaci]|eukprot:XP_009828356.1 hypothetical protein H257_05253 [Aphanomyces astaci]